MHTYQLSSSSERIAGAVMSLFIAIIMGLLVWLLRKDTLMLIILVMVGILVLVMLSLYMANLFRSACAPKPEEQTLEVAGLIGCRLDLKEAKSVETRPMTSGPVTTRVILFTDAKGNALETVPTFFTVHGGAQAEPVARDIARDLGLTFKENLEPWEYDSKARKEHDAAESAERKAARREKLARIKAKFSSGKAKADVKPAPAPEEEKEIFEDNINYDALDDEK